MIKDHPNLELVQEPTLSICCLRYINDDVDDLNKLNTRIHRRLVHNSQNIPGTGMIDGKLVIRPCFIGTWASREQAQNLIDELLAIGRQLTTSEKVSNNS